jgi:hypothetical protein
MSFFNSKLATTPFQGRDQMIFTPDNTDFKEHYRLNQGPMKSDYLSRIQQTGEEPSQLADEAFGMGQFSAVGPHPGLTGRSLDQFFGIRLRPRVQGSTAGGRGKRLQQIALSINPEFPSLGRDSMPLRDAPHEVTLGHLLQTPSFLVQGSDGQPRTLGSIEDSSGIIRDDHPTNSLNRGLIIERRLREEAMQRLESHPAIKMRAGEIDWTTEAHKAVENEVSRFRKDIHGLYHGGGVTLADGTKIGPLFLSKNSGNFITDVNEHFEPHPDDQEEWDKAMTAFSNTTKGTGMRLMRDRAHSPWAQVYDTSFQRRIESSNDSTLKDVFKTHLGEKGQHRYVAGAPVARFPQEVSNWKTALADRLRVGTRGIDMGVPSPTQAELSMYPEPKKRKSSRVFSSKK